MADAFQVSQPRVFVHSRCSTCRRALAWLREVGVPFETVDIIATPPGSGVLAEALAQLTRSRLLNTSGRSYRSLGAATVKALTDDALTTALASDGGLIRRPFLQLPGGRFLTGFKVQEWQELLEPLRPALDP